MQAIAKRFDTTISSGALEQSWGWNSPLEQSWGWNSPLEQSWGW